MKIHRHLVGVLLLVLAAAALFGASAGQSRDEQRVEGSATTARNAIDLATYPAKRWIVQLQAPALARYRALRGYRLAGSSSARLNVAAPASRAYLGVLRRQQRAFTQRLARVARGARVERTYRVTLNGLAVRMSHKQAAAVRSLPGVRAVTPDVPYHLDMYATPQQIGASTLWSSLGGQANAGRGVKVAIIDSGIYVTRDAAGNFAGNPCFNDTGFRRPGGFPKGDRRFTNNKVIVARAYFRPDDPPTAGNETPLPGPGGSSHGTHVAGTVGCNAGTAATSQGASVTLSGVAPRAWLMNYRVFYPSQSPEDFQNGNAYVVELVQAIEDAVEDGADVLSNSWGSSYQNTLDWPDPMVQAAEAAVDAGVVGVWAQGNSGPATATGNLPSASPKLISVGAVTKNATIVPGVVDVTAPTPVPASLQAMDVGPAGFGEQVTTQKGPALYVPAQRVATSGSSLGCSAFPAGSLTGKIALIQRGVCEFSTKVFNAQQAGALAALVYNSAAGGDNLQSMGPGALAPMVTIPSWFMRRSQGLAMVSFANANPTTAEAKFTFQPHSAPNIGDVVAGFSSRGPTQDKLLKPDVGAPGVDVLSGGFASGAFPANHTGFGSVSGTSMATPHVAGAAALLKQLHRDWEPAQIKSALMTTATENVFLNTTLTRLAGVLDRGAGRIDLAKAGNPGLTLDQPSLSGGELRAGQGVGFTIEATDVTEEDDEEDVTGEDDEEGDTWDVSTLETGSVATTANFNITAGVPSVFVEEEEEADVPVRVEATPTAAPGNYEGSVVLVSRSTGTRLHVPVWLRVVRAPTTDLLLVDDDGSSFGVGLVDYSAAYKSMLDGLGVSYDYIDVGAVFFPSVHNLFKYRAVLVFTGDNDSFDTSGFFPSDQDALTEWLDSGGRLWTSGQNFAETSDSNGFDSARIGRARLYHGYLGITQEAPSVYGGAAPRPTASGHGPMAGMTLDVSPGADGAGNQSSIEAGAPMADNDTYMAIHTVKPFFRQLGGSAPAGTAVSFGRASEPSLEEERVEFRYRSASMGFGLEGVNSTTGFTTRQQLADRTLDWLLDTIAVGLGTVTTNKKRATLTALATSSAGASFTRFRWDFGDDSRIVTTTGPTVRHKFKHRGTHVVRIEATDSLGHRAIGQGTVTIRKKDD